MPHLQKPFIIPIFIPHAGCPHQCAFCNQNAITHMERSSISIEKIHEQIKEFLAYKRENRKNVQISFYGGNFLGLKPEDIKCLLHEAGKFISSGEVDSLRFSTRPDTITPDTLDLLTDFPVSTVEIGVQSMNDDVLKLSRRGHTARDTENAVELLKKRGYKIGLQMMTGLPGDTPQGAIESGMKIAGLSPDFVRIYPAVVLENSLLARWFREEKYKPLSLDSSVTLVKELYLLFREKQIPVIRMGLQASEELDSGAAILAGPYHPAFGHLVYSEIFLDKAVSAIKSLSVLEKNISIRVHSKNISKIRGLKNRNIEIMKKMFHLKSLKIIPDDSVLEEDVVIL